MLSPEGSFIVYAGEKYLSYVFFLKKIEIVSATEEERDD